MCGWERSLSLRSRRRTGNAAVHADENHGLPQMTNKGECERITAPWAIGAAGAQVPYKHKVGGSNPSSPTRIFRPGVCRLAFFAGSTPGLCAKRGCHASQTGPLRRRFRFFASFLRSGAIGHDARSEGRATGFSWQGVGCRPRVAIGSMSPRPVPDCPGRFRFVPTWFVAPPPDPIRFILFRFDSFLPDRPGRFRFDPTRPVPSRFGRSHTVLTECGRPVPSRLDSSHPVPFSPVLHRRDWLRPDPAGSSRPVPFGPSLPDLFRMPPFAPASGLARWATRGRGSSRMPRAF